MGVVNKIVDRSTLKLLLVCIHACIVLYMNTTTATQVLDMNTTDGLTRYLMTLPTANLANIAARPIWDAESAKMIAAAGMILDSRKVSV